MDIVYILGNGSLHNNLELKYSLTTVKHFVKDAGRIFIIGEDPGFEGDFTFYPFPDCGRNKQDNIRKKIEYTCGLPEISDNFLFMNDDHFFNAPVEISKYPYYYSQYLLDKYEARKVPGHYKSAMRNTLEAHSLERQYFLKYFDIHTPIRYNKALFITVMAEYDWGIKDGYIIKSLYANNLKACLSESEELEDLVFRDWITSKSDIINHIQGKHIWSIAPGGTNDIMVDFLLTGIAQMK